VQDGQRMNAITDKEVARHLYHQALHKQWGPEPDIDLAIPLYRQSADLGFAGAQNNLGDCYERGIGVPQSDVTAVYWYTRAAERGEPTAYLGLASMLYKNFGDEAVLVEALKYALLAKALLPEGGNKDLATVQEGLIVSKLSPQGIARAIALHEAWDPLTQEANLQDDNPAFTPLDFSTVDQSRESVVTVKQSQDSFEALWSYCQQNQRIVPRDWMRLYRKLWNKRTGNEGRPEPPLPLILAAWHTTTALEKMMRFRCHLEWARDQGQIEIVGKYLRTLDEEGWIHLDEH
jgi:TPR repeat protein